MKPQKTLGDVTEINQDHPSATRVHLSWSRNLTDFSDGVHSNQSQYDIYRRKVGVKQTSLLILDDNSSFAESLSDVLGRVGFACRWTPLPMEALKMAGIEAPDVLLVDVNLGTASGIEVAQQLCREFHNTGVVFMTGSIDLDHRQIPIDLRCRSVVLHKPVDKEMLLGAIASVSAKASGSTGSAG